MPNFLDFFEKNKISPRSQQCEVLSKLESNWDRYDNFVISAPTGVGKSFIALAIAMGTTNSFLLTGTKSLQSQYIETSDQLYNIKGRANYPCGLNRTVRADMGPCSIMPQIKRKCYGNGSCIYHNAKLGAKKAKTMLTNYAYFLTALNSGSFGEPYECKRAVVLCDEAHDLEKCLINFAECVISPSDINKKFHIQDPAWKFGNSEKKNLEILFDIKAEIGKEMNKCTSQIDLIYAKYGITSEDTSGMFKMNGADTDKIAKLGLKLAQLDRTIKPIDIYEANQSFRWIIDANTDDNTLKISPISASGIFSEYMQHFGGKFVFMSATIGDPNVFCRELGLDPERTAFIRTGTDFPAENAPIVFCPVGKMNYKDLPATMPKIVAGVIEILKGHAEDKGIIHTGNYKISQAIIDGLPRELKSRLIHRDMKYGQKISNEDLVRMHTHDKGPTVLISPSLGTGTSLDDDLSRFQIIVKLPFPSLLDARVKIKADEDPDWYLDTMWREVQQSSGRSIRSMEDHAVTYVLDSSTDWFFKKAEKVLPPHFKERWHW